MWQNIIGFLGWGFFLALCGCAYLLLVCIVAEFALGKPKVNEYGGLRIKKDCFVISNFYRNNVFQSGPTIINPGNDCQLIRGFFWGIPYGIIGLIVMVVGSCVVLCIMFFCGYLFDFKNSEGKPYERYGKK